MKKKNTKVPEWLNTPLWKSPTTEPPSAAAPPQPNDPPPPQYINSNDDVSNSFIKTPKPAPAPVSPSPSNASSRAESVVAEASKQKTKDPLSGSYCNSDDDNRSSCSATSVSEEVGEAISRRALLSQELSRKVINMRDLRRLSSQGIPDGGGIRATVWKLLLGYLPCDRSLWSSELVKKRSQYKEFKEDLLMNPSEISRRLETSVGSGNYGLHNEEKGFLPRSEITEDEHPLSLGKTSIWNQFFQDTDIIEQIDRDVKRTHPDINFFSGDTSFAKSNQESLKNVLIVFAKLNPGIRYVQGMNEILAPLFYVFKSDPKEENAVSVEADTFFCFVELISGFRDNFCQKLDNSVVGIRSTISKLSQLLKEHDEELWRHLEVTTKVNPQFYAFRWITLLLTQEFDFADILVIWDTLLSDPEGPQETLLRICCAMLIMVRRRLLAGDFTSNLKLLQSYPSTNINHLLYVANKLHTQSAGQFPF